jgi:mRNA interferase MazF
MKQGDVYWYTFRAPNKRRPVLVLTRNSALPYLSGNTVAEITTTIRGMASEVTLTPGEDGMFAECVVNADNIQTIQKSQLGELITELSPERMREVRQAIEFALGFDALVRF